MYRVSSRSFPNRHSQQIGQAIAIVPNEGYETDIYKNPYIAYNCLRLADNFAVVGNGTHVDPIVEKLESGMNMRDAIVSVLYGMDYEHDDYNTPRITAVTDVRNRLCALGIVRQDALLVKNFKITQGEAFYIATYEHNYPSKDFSDKDFHIASAEEACDYILGKGVFSSLERPISAACAMEVKNGYSISYKDVEK
jgi:IMP cyclohydrolase